MRKSQVICRFFKADGSCVKGDYCEFSHITNNESILCRFYSSKSICPFGKSCSFKHSDKVSSSRSEPARKNISAVDPIDIKTSATDMMVKNSSPSLSNLWGLPDDDDPIHGYGNNLNHSLKISSSAMNYAAAVVMNNEVEKSRNQSVTITTPIVTTEPTFQGNQANKATICSYFLVGRCRYGTLCRMAHPNDNSQPSDRCIASASQTMVYSITTQYNTSSQDCQTDDVSTVIENKSLLAGQVECGICMGQPEDGRLGLLSHCYCTFCIKCIRQWRRAGTEISSSGQTRLCPLCRVESHFVIPSTTLVTDPVLKAKLVDDYISAVREIPCKHYQTGSCPFGSSCFYLHISREGVLEEKVMPRQVIDADRNMILQGDLNLADFIMPRRI